MPLPPELADLEASYAQILAQVDARTLSPEQAIDTVNRLVVFDGDGTQWTVSLDTEPPNTVFLAARPGEQPNPADPTRFAPTPGFTAPAPQSPPPGTGDWMTTPPDTGASGPFGGPAGHPQAPGPQEPWVADIAPPAPPGAGGQRNTTGGAGGAKDALRSLLPFGPKDSNATPTTSPLAGRGRLIGFIVAAVVVVLVARACLAEDSAEAPEPEGPAALECPTLTADVAGIEGRDAQLLGCLDGTDNAGTADSGPQVAFMAVTSSPEGEIVFASDKVMSRAEAAATAAGLYRFAGGRPPSETVEVSLDEIDPALQTDTQLAVDLGLVLPENLNGNDPVTRGSAALMLARALAAANGEELTGTSPATDTDGVSESLLTAHGYLAEKGIVDPGSAAFGFDEQLTAIEWVRLAGPAAHLIKNPDAAPAAPSTSESGTGELDGDTISTALTALTSGRAELVAELVVGADAESNETILRAAGYAGLDAAGLQISSSAPSVDGDEATSDLSITDGEDGTVVGTAKAQWRLVDGEWRLADWPDLTPA